ncbi:MAG: replication initiation protein [Bacteroidales bacterium]|nr:replication initiation protein [Bacteroidales bacterium]
MQNCDTKTPLQGTLQRPVQTDELYQTNSVTYIEANLKINHLRILMAIIKHLQQAIRYKVGRTVSKGRIPDLLLPPPADPSRHAETRVLEIPVSDFHMGLNNGARLRSCLDELVRTRIVFPRISPYYLDTFPGLIAGYDFPPYAKKVSIYLRDPMVGRLLLTEEGYSHYSHSKALSLTNKYTVRLYWLICSWRNRGGFVISLDKLRQILQLGPAYERYGNIAARVLNPSMEELRSRFPIWFLYRLYKKVEGPVIAFKIKVRLAPEEERRLRNEAYDYCYKLLTRSGIGIHPFTAIFDSVDTEDIKPLVAKLTALIAHISARPGIHSPESYISASLTAWHNDWLRRYQDLPE